MTSGLICLSNESSERTKPPIKAWTGCTQLEPKNQCLHGSARPPEQSHVFQALDFHSILMSPLGASVTPAPFLEKVGKTKSTFNFPGSIAYELNNKCLNDFAMDSKE